MKYLLRLLPIVIILSFSPAIADWKFETFEGVQVHYYLPKTEANYNKGNAKKALMVNLHGCAQKAEDLKLNGNWENTADDYNMVVAIPKVPNGGVISGCWDYYGADHTTTNRHNSAIIKLVTAMLSSSDLNIDPTQVYVSGLSSGGGETMVLGCMMPEMFAGLGINAGPSIGSTSGEISRPKTTIQTSIDVCKKLGRDKSDSFKTQLTSIIYGNNDFIVSTTFDTNNAEIMKTIYDAQIKSTFDTTKLSGAATAGTGTLWSDELGPRVSLIMNTNLGHNWPAGQGGNGGAFINKKSINYPDYLARFFSTNNRRSKNIILPEVMFDAIDTKESRFIVSGVVTIPRSFIKTIEVTITSKTSRAIVDQFEVSLDKENQFSGLSKVLADGEYNFDFNVKNTFGQSKIFRRNSWLGNVIGVNAPQIFNTHFQSVQGCLIIHGQAVNNGEEKISSIKIVIDGNQIYETSVVNTKWGFRNCTLQEGVHEAIVYAVNESGLKSNTQSFLFESSAFIATATLQDHMDAKRLNWVDYGPWYLKYGHQSFALYLGEDLIWREKSVE